MRRHCRECSGSKGRGSPGGVSTQDWLCWRQIFTGENTPAAQDREDQGSKRVDHPPTGCGGSHGDGRGHSRQ